MASADIGIDLGTSSILVYVKGRGVVLREPAVVAYDKDQEKIVEIGEEARLMLGRTPGNIISVKPLRHGVISDYTTTEKMLKYFIRKAVGRNFFGRRPKICVCVPSGVTEVDKRAVEEATYNAGAREVTIIEEPIAAAIGAGIDIVRPVGNMVVDIGGGTTDIAVISAGIIAAGTSIKCAGEAYTEALIRYMKRKYNIELGELSAEEAKMEVGSVLPRKTDLSYEVKGKNILSGLPVRFDLSANETVAAFEEQTNQIITAITGVLENTPPELAGDIAKEGILLSGGGSLIYGMARLIQQKTGIRVTPSDEPENVVAAGAGMAGEYIMLKDEEKRERRNDKTDD